MEDLKLLKMDLLVLKLQLLLLQRKNTSGKRMGFQIFMTEGVLEDENFELLNEAPNHLSFSNWKSDGMRRLKKDG